MPYTLAEAAKATGLNRTTILRSIKSGKISGTRDRNGGWLVEAAELHRIFPAQDTPAAKHQVAHHDAALEAQIDGLRQVADLLRSQLEDVKHDRDQWRDQAQRLAITDQREQARSWWRRLAG